MNDMVANISCIPNLYYAFNSAFMSFLELEGQSCLLYGKEQHDLSSKPFCSTGDSRTGLE